MKTETLETNKRKKSVEGVPAKFVNAWTSIEHLVAGNYVKINASTEEVDDVRSMLLYMHKHKIAPSYIVSVTNKDDSIIVICRQREVKEVMKLCNM